MYDTPPMPMHEQDREVQVCFLGISPSSSLLGFHLTLTHFYFPRWHRFALRRKLEESSPLLIQAYGMRKTSASQVSVPREHRVQHRLTLALFCRDPPGPFGPPVVGWRRGGRCRGVAPGAPRVRCRSGLDCRLQPAGRAVVAHALQEAVSPRAAPVHVEVVDHAHDDPLGPPAPKQSPHVVLDTILEQVDELSRYASKCVMR